MRFEEKLKEIKKEISSFIVGQEYMIERVLIGVLAGGHILLEGLPGLAKSSTVDTIAKVIGLRFRRIQFTPDLMPSDILGSVVYYQKTGEFITRKGPIFSNIILADEINRAPAKVQSALLEAMQERQVTIGGNSHRIQAPFIVLATQNPLDHDGTYSLPAAQQDRFMMKLVIDYPSSKEEMEILNTVADPNRNYEVKNIVSKKDIFNIRDQIRETYIDDKLKEYIVKIVQKSRQDSKYISCGASPRAAIAMMLASKGMAFFNSRDHVRPEDIKGIAHDVLRHRIILSYEAEANEVTTSNIIDNILETTKAP